MAGILKQYLPSFRGLWHGSIRLLDWLWLWLNTPWLSTPWWPADTLASKQRSLTRMLAAAATERLEVAPLAACLSQEHRGRFRRRLRRLAQRLAAGMSLADALEQTPGALSDEQALAVRFGDQSGTLPATLAHLLESRSQMTALIAWRLRQLSFYLTLVLTVFVLILSFLLIKIVPSFAAIFDDFDLELPRPMILLIYVSRVAVDYWYVILLVLLGLAWLVRSERSRRFFRRHVLSRFLPPIARLRAADLLDLLSVTVSAGRPLSGALSTLARYHFDTFVRGKLLFVRNEVEQGADAWNSMATARLLTPAEARALESSPSGESRAWSMRELAQVKRSHVARRIELYVSILQPVLILLLGGLVLFVAVACLSPLFNLVSGLTG